MYPKRYCRYRTAIPPIFSAAPNRNRILSQENHPPSLEYEVDSLFIPGLNLSAVSGITIFLERGWQADDLYH